MSEVSIARQLARYSSALDAERLPSSVLACVRQRVVDSLACIVGAYDAPPVSAGLALARSVPVPASTLFGTQSKTTPDLAAFVNGVMVRYLDYNDGYMGKEPGHPSDNIPACLAVAEAESRTGRELVAAIVIAYEIQMRLQDAASLNRHGWDQANYINVASAAAASRLLGLDEDQTEQAINIALNGHIAMRQVRSGALSDWKGCSAANASRNAVFAAQLARHGMTGPAPIFEGKMGLFAQLTGEFELDVDQFGGANTDDFAILRSLTKSFPTNGELHTAVWAAIELRDAIADPGQIDEILIETSEFNCRVLADADKWRPATRETADHSLPYNVARALLDGDITIESYGAEKISQPNVLALMDRTTVREDPALTALFPGRLANRIIVTLKSGERLVREVRTGPGSVETPMTDADFERKFRRTATHHLKPGAPDQVLAFVASLEKQTSYAPLFGAMVRADG
jgi:2-methylcitrate dehydratase